MIKNKVDPVRERTPARGEVVVVAAGEKPHSEDKTVFARLWGRKRMQSCRQVGRPTKLDL